MRLKLISTTLLLVAAASAQLTATPPASGLSATPAQDAKTFYKNLPKAPVTQELFNAALKAADEVGTMPKAELQDLLPIIFADVKDDTDGTKHALLGLYAASRRPDSGEVMRPYLKTIAGFLDSPSGAMRATAGHIFMNMQPQPPEAADILLGFINGPTGGTNEKIDALASLNRMANPPKDRMEAAAIHIFKQPLDARTMSAAINAIVAPGGASDALVDAIAAQLNHADRQVRIQAIFAMRRLGPGAIGRHRGDIAKLANDKEQPEAIREFAQNTLDGKDEKCVSLHSDGTSLQLVPIPGCTAK